MQHTDTLLIQAVDNAIPRTLPIDIREETRSLAILAILSGEINLDALQSNLRYFIKQAWRNERGDYQAISLDAPMQSGDNDPSCLKDRLSNEGIIHSRAHHYPGNKSALIPVKHRTQAIYRMPHRPHGKIVAIFPQIEEMALAGHSASEIAQKLGIADATAMRYAKKICSSTGNGLYATDWKLYGFSITPNRPAAQEFKKVEQLVLAGNTYADIRQNANVDKSTVGLYIKRICNAHRINIITEESKNNAAWSRLSNPESYPLLQKYGSIKSISIHTAEQFPLIERMALDGYSYQDIANAANIKLTMARVHVQRIRRANGLSRRPDNTKRPGVSAIDQTGKTIGYYYVIGRDEEMFLKYNATFWRCKCICGNEVIVSSGGLRGSNKKHCGCIGHKKAEAARKSAA